MSGIAERIFVKGNEAVCMGAIAAGCRFYYGYPITPQNEIPEWMSAHLPALGGTFLQAESEVATINYILGTASTGTRVMTSSSSPGISLMAEGISYMAGQEVPCVLVNIQRGGPGLGGIGPSQGDYLQSVKGCGHGGYKLPVLAPHSVEEMYTHTMLAFDLADRYRTPALVLGDAIVGQMKEPFIPVPYEKPQNLGDRNWALTGCAGRERRWLKSLYLNGDDLELHNWKLWRKWEEMKREVRYEDFHLEGARIAIVAFGTAARVAKTAIQWARDEGIAAGMLRPITLYPFPEKAIDELAHEVDAILVVEMNLGQMVDDVRAATSEHSKIHFFGKPCALPTPDEILREIQALAGKGTGWTR